MADIKDKLREARYFLEQMKAAANEISFGDEPLDAPDDVGVEEVMDWFTAELGARVTKAWETIREPVRYNLSAFLSAGRSVVFMLRMKFGRVPGFKTWMDKAEGEEEMRRLTRMRDTSIHRRPVRPYMGNVDVDVTEDMRQITVSSRWVFYEIPDEDAIDICEEHMRKLERLAGECESLFAEKGQS